ncbi:MAG: AAA family ATPase [Chloroflexota bacterium]|nr:AAA family ATPase [Chloroflexota bacterium]
MARWPGAEAVYQTADLFRQRCLIEGKSLLWPDQPAWTIENVDALIGALTTDPGPSEATFIDKLNVQLANEPDDVLRVAADVLTLYYLYPSRPSVKATTKLARIQTILDWRPDALALADPNRQRLNTAFAEGIGAAGPSYVVNIPWHLVFFLAFARGVLQGDSEPGDAGSCQRLIAAIAQQPNRWVQARQVLLHLLFPDQFERIASEEHKRKIVEAFRRDAGGEQDLDDALANIRQALADRLDRTEIDFYQPDIRNQWDAESIEGSSPVPPPSEPHHRDDPAVFKALIEEFYPDSSTKLACLRQLAASIRAAHVISPESWGISLRKSDPAPKLNVGRIQTLCLRRDQLDVWVDRESAGDDLWVRIQEELELSILWGGTAPRSMPIAFGFALPGSDVVETLPILRPIHLALVERAATAQRRTNFNAIHCSGMVEYLRQELAEDIPDPEYGTEATPDREPAGTNALEPSYSEPSFSEIVALVAGQGLRLDERTLRRYHLALKTRGFVILSGLSGSGKTWLAEVYAGVVGARHAIVPVAPNWTTNEDLLGYQNPLTNLYHDTAFGRFLREAAAAWRRAEAAGQTAQPYHVVLDEMNLASVEYYFAKFLSAMETRARAGSAALEFGPNDTVELTPNLKVIGTVNFDETTRGFANKIYDRAQLVEIEARREDIAAHLAGRPYQVDLLRIWDDLHHVAPFTFRVLDEIAAYVTGGAALGVPWEEALDEQLLHKVLPKINGADPAVGTALATFVGRTAGRFPLSHARATEMLKGFELHGFASYFR